MASKEYDARIKLKRDTSSNWTTNNPVIMNGEIILVDTAEGELRAKVGDGSKTYTQLPFTDEVIRNLIPSVDSEISGTSENPVQNRAVSAALSEKITHPDDAVGGQVLYSSVTEGDDATVYWTSLSVDFGDFATQSSVDVVVDGLRGNIDDVAYSTDTLSAKLSALDENLSQTDSKIEDINGSIEGLSEDISDATAASLSNGAHIADLLNRIAELEAVIESMKTSISVQYASIGTYSRFEDYNDGEDSMLTGCFFIGGES